jgi:ankyrin repeat protein
MVELCNRVKICMLICHRDLSLRIFHEPLRYPAARRNSDWLSSSRTGSGSNNSGRTALQAAAERGHLVVVERLILEKADVNAVPSSYSGRTALQAAAGGGHLAVVERLIYEKVDVNAKPSMYFDRIALQAAAEGSTRSFC